MNREALPFESFTVKAIDFGSPSRNSTTIISITIGDENDMAPQFTQDLYILSINNVSPPGTQLLTLMVEDPDETGLFAFRIISSEAEVFQLFTVDSPEGILRQRSTRIPEDYLLQYSFIIEVNDELHTATTEVIINIITVTTATVHILENAPHTFDLRKFLQEGGFNITTAATYTILSGNTAMDFRIASNGSLITQGLDHESIKEYSLAINVTDVSSNEIANVLVNIVVNDVNDNSPVFPGNYMFSTLEGTYSTHTLLGIVEATDMDDPSTRNARLSYSLLAPNTDGFSISSDGNVSLIGTFDREDRALFTFIVRAQDFGEPEPETGYTSVSVNILDINDNNPQFVPFDVVEFFVEVVLSSENEVGRGSVLDNIVAVLPVDNITVDLKAFHFFDPDSTSVVSVSLLLLKGANKYTLQNEKDKWVLVATDFIRPDDNGTVLQIILSDQPLKEEDDPVIRNVTIKVFEFVEPPTIITPKTEAEGTESTFVGFWTTEIGIAVIVVITLVFLALLLLCVSLSLYGLVLYRRSKDPLKAK